MHDSLLTETIARFPQHSLASVRVEPLEKGGSDRKFYRIAFNSGESLILAKYGTQREENRHYVDIARFLDKAGIRVPRIYFEDPVENLIWMEDLGERDLWSYRNEPWPVRRRLYQSALDQVLALHSRVHVAYAQENAPPKLQPEFDAALYRWEQNYFIENCLGRHFGIAQETLPESMTSRLHEIAETLASRPRVFVHRDFQSQNIVVKNNAACLIDFQGMRPGLAQYDLASLFLDPYVELETEQREELLSYYLERSPYVEDPEDFRATYHLCAMQRLMQALGAYGFLGLVRGRADFLAHIPAAIINLRSVLPAIPGLEPLLQLAPFA